MNKPTISPGMAARLRVFGPLPYSYFTCEQVRSLTVHLEHAGEWKVSAPLENGERVAFPDYFANWSDADTIKQAANAVWRAVPGASAAQVVALVMGPQYVQTLRPGLRRALYESSDCANELNALEANAIAARYGLTADEMRPDWEQANRYGQERIGAKHFCGASDEESARLHADHTNRFPSARFLFDGYCYEQARVSHCESQEASRSERDYN